MLRSAVPHGRPLLARSVGALLVWSLHGCVSTHGTNISPSLDRNAFGIDRPGAARRFTDASEDRSEASRPPARSVHLLLKLAERRLYVLDGEDTYPSPRAESFPVAVG